HTIEAIKEETIEAIVKELKDNGILS
ncbi:transcription repressor NadR, partial [Clostridioides difficile]